jgi:hypothetical protein
MREILILRRLGDMRYSGRRESATGSADQPTRNLRILRVLRAINFLSPKYAVSIPSVLVKDDPVYFRHELGS